MSSLLVVIVALLAAIPTAIAQPYGLDQAQPIGPYLNNVFPSTAPSSSAAWNVEVAFTNATFNQPIFLTPYPGTNRLVILHKQGRISTFPNRRDVTQEEVLPFLDISSRTFTVSDCGLTGIAFHPQFGQAGSTDRGFFYVTYKWRPGSVGNAFPEYAYWRLSRFNVPDGQTVADPNSEVVLVQQLDRQMFHDAGCMLFGSDGFLYFSVGDEGGANDQFNSTQTLSERLMSGIFRIDVDQNPALSHPIRRQPFQHPATPIGWPESFTSNYFVPNSNPFVNTNGSVLEEYYALGFRQPYRFSRDPITGLIWVADSGQSTREEIDILVPGANYQWAYREGTAVGPKAKPATIIGFEKGPLWDYGRDQGGAAIGGYVYRGVEHASFLTGKYIFVDNVSGRIWAIISDGTTLSDVEYLTSMPSGSVYGGTSSCGMDAQGEIYFLKFGGDGAQRIFKLSRTTTIVPEPPALLSQVGAFVNLETLTPAPGLIPYDVNSPLWSDAAEKLRWMAIPNDGDPSTADEKISFSATNDWRFPPGSVLVKQFDLPVDENNPSVRRLETRFLISDQHGGVYGVTYKWRADGSDADLLLTGESAYYNILTTSQTIRTQRWDFPSRQDCLTCHNGNTSGVLGPKTHQLNGDFHYPQTGRTDNQLRTLGHLGFLSSEYNEAQLITYLKSHNITNTSQPLVTRVRSYIDANCSHCHQPGGQRANFDARYANPLEQQNLIYGAVLDAVNGPEDRVVRPQNLLNSMLHNRANRVGALQMPPLAKNLVDTNAVQVFADWINSLPVGPGVTLARTNTNPLVSGMFAVNVEFTEPVYGVSADQFIVSNGQATSLSGSGQGYTLMVVPQAKGPVSVQFPANQVTDAAEHGNYPSNPLTVSFDPLNQFLSTWLPFDEVFGTMADDASGNGNPGTLVNLLPTAWSVGIIGGALDFDGFDDYVQISNHLGANFTISCWIKTSQVFPLATSTFEGTGIIWSDVGGLNHDFILGGTRSSNGVSRLSFFVGGSESSLNGTQPINTGQWTHLAVTRDGNSGAVQLYVNGVIDVSAAAGLGVLNANPKIHIGGNTLDGHYFNGLIDDVRFYSRVLSASEIVSLQPEPPLTATLTTSSSTVTNTFFVTASFNRSVSGFGTNSIEILNGTVSQISGGGANYYFAVTPETPGTVTISIPPNRVVDVNGTSNLASPDLVVTAMDSSTPGNSLIGYWPFDEYNDLTAFDFSGIANDGTLVNFGNTNRVVGVWGNALSFDGVNDHVAISNTIGGDFTISFWIKSSQVFPQTEVATSGTGLIWSDVGGPNNDFVIGGTRSASGTNRLSFFTGNPNSSIHGQREISRGQWTHLAVVRIQSIGTRKLFVDGMLDGSDAGSTGFLSANPAIHFGGNTLNHHYFFGQMDEVRIYNRALSDSEVASLAAAGGYQSWIATTMPGIVPALTESIADPDNDGQPNLLEFALGSDPLAADGSAFTIDRSSDGALILSYPRRTGFSGLIYTIWKSEDLIRWFPVTEEDFDSVQIVPGNPLEWFEGKLNGMSQPGFFRLEVRATQ